MGDLDLIPVHFGKKTTGLVFDDFVKSFHKGFCLWIGDNIEVLKVFYFFMIAVAEVRYEFVDMIGDDVFDVFFTSSLKTKDLGNLKGIVTLISYFEIGRASCRERVESGVGSCGM